GDEPDGDGRPVAAPPRDSRRLLREMAVAPLHQGQEGDAKLSALLRQAVFESLGPLAVPDTLEHFLGDEPIQPVRQNVACDPEAVEQLIEATETECDVANDKERPAVADELERPCDRADLALIVPVQHVASVARVTCMMQVTSSIVARMARRWQVLLVTAV